MGEIICPFDTCIYNKENECQRLLITLKTCDISGEELLDCESYERKK